MDKNKTVSPHEHTGQVWLVSACLLGFQCRYDGKTASEPARKRLKILSNEKLIPICPEESGGLGTPRLPAVIHGTDGKSVLDGTGRIINEEGQDVTDAFKKGAFTALQAAQAHGATHACLKARSPSCGVGETHTADGLVKGDGVTAALLRREGLHVFNDEDRENLSQEIK